MAALQLVSSGCAALNDPSFDGSYTSQASPDGYFFAGETISAKALTPPSGSDISVTLEFPYGLVVDSAPSPGSVSYQVQVNGLAFPGGRATTGGRVAPYAHLATERARLWREYNYPVMSPLLEMTFPFTPN